MNEFGLLLWLMAFVALAAIGGGLYLRYRKGQPGNTEKMYLLVSWLTLPLTSPALLLRFMPPPGPKIPPALTIIALICTMMGALLAIVGVVLIIISVKNRRVPSAIIATCIANLFPLLALSFQ